MAVPLDPPSWSMNLDGVGITEFPWLTSRGVDGVVVVSSTWDVEGEPDFSALPHLLTTCTCFHLR